MSFDKSPGMSIRMITSNNNSDPTLIVEGFMAHGESNPSDGIGPRYEIGRYSTIEEAITAAQGKGVQGDSGTVSAFTTLVYPNGTVKTLEKPVIKRRLAPDRKWLVGYIDLREYEYGVREAGNTEMRSASSTLAKKFVMSESESQMFPVIEPVEVRRLLIEDPAKWVGLWRMVGDLSWRGEFQASTNTELDQWLPKP